MLTGLQKRHGILEDTAGEAEPEEDNNFNIIHKSESINDSTLKEQFYNNINIIYDDTMIVINILLIQNYYRIL